MRASPAMSRGDSMRQTASLVRRVSAAGALLSGVSRLRVEKSDLPLAVAGDVHESAGPGDCILLRLDLKQGEAAHNFLRLGEGSVRDSHLAIGPPDARAGRAVHAPLGRQKHALTGHL